MSTGEWIQIAVAGVLTLTLVAVVWYGWQARSQAKASARIAEAALRPVMVLWADPYVPHHLPGGEVSYNVRYKNIGNGPALNIRFCLGFVDGRWLEQDTRVSMGVGDEESPLGVKVPLPIPDQLFVTAEYEDASHSRWKTTVRLQKEGVFLRNRESKLERIGG
jgi:hypothetical protein